MSNRPAVWLDHKMTCPARLGSVRFLVHDFDTNRLGEVTIHRNATVKVLAR